MSTLLAPLSLVANDKLILVNACMNACAVSSVSLLEKVSDICSSPAPRDLLPGFVFYVVQEIEFLKLLKRLGDIF